MSDVGGAQRQPPSGSVDEAGQEGPPTIPPSPRFGPALRWAVPDVLSVPPEPAMPVAEPGLEAQGRPEDDAQPEDELTRQVEGLPWFAGAAPPGPGWADEGPAATPGPPASPAGRLGRRRPRRVLVFVGAVVVLAALAAGGLLAWALPSGPGPAATFSALLTRSTQAHYLVGAAVADVCRRPEAGVGSRARDLAKLEQAVALRQEVLRELHADANLAPRLPDGAALYHWLKQVTVSSLTADQAYEGWTHDREDMGCYGGPGNDTYWDRARQAAGTAQLEVARLGAAWAVVAPKLGLSPSLADNA